MRLKQIGKIFGAGLIAFWGLVPAQAQMTVSQERQPTALVKEVLLGGGVMVDNVHFAGIIGGLGEFQSSSEMPIFSHGIVLSTGNATDLAGPNDSPKTSTVLGSPGDKDLIPFAGGRTFDGGKLTFDFKAALDSVTLNFVFASEEYHDYVGSSFNDAFAIVVSGLEHGGGKNLAVIPGTNTPITVNSINPNTNRQYFHDNNPYTLVGRINETAKANLNKEVLANFEYDGLTKTMSIGFRVKPKQVYHLEITISDAGDGTVDSAVLLEAKSFKTLEQSWHVRKREQARQDSLAREQARVDSLYRAQAVADSLAEVADRLAKAEALRRANQARLDSIARVENEVRLAKHRQDSILKAQEAAARAFAEQMRRDSIEQVQRMEAERIAAERREQERLDSLKRAQQEAALRAEDDRRQRQRDSTAKAEAALAQLREQHRIDSIAKANSPSNAGNPTLGNPPPQEVKEVVVFPLRSYLMATSDAQRLNDLGKLLMQNPALRAGIYLPHSQDADLMNMRYDMLRFELLKAGARTDQIFRNYFSFTAQGSQASPDRGEIWIRTEQ